MWFSQYRRGPRDRCVRSGLPLVALVAGAGVLYRRAVTATAKAASARVAAASLGDEVRDARIHLEHAQRLAGVGGWEWDLTARRMSWSAEQARLHGWTDSVPPAGLREMLELIAPEDRSRVSDAIDALLAMPSSSELEYTVREGRGGRRLRVQATSAPDEHGRPARVIGTSRDVTESCRRAEAERANVAKNEFISRMSHELRTPLNAILGFGQLMTMSELDERQRGNVDHILTAGKHLLDLINEILDISRIESGDLHLVLEPLSVRAMIEQAIDLVSPFATERDIEVTADAGDADVDVRADAQRLKQVLLNLLSNAVKYSNGGGHVRVRSARGGSDRVLIVVEDDGPGIAPGMIERLFNPFERLGAEQSSVEGTGLGLTLSRGMIEAMGGRIHVGSELGHGTAFTIELEAAPSRVPAASSRGNARGEAAPIDAPATVLFVDDNPSNLELVAQILRGRRHINLLTAMRGEDGLRLALERVPDVVLLDMNLPDMSGEEVLARLKSNPATVSVPVVILTADSSSLLIDRVLRRGARLHLPKPIDVGALIAAIDEFVREPVSGPVA